VKKVFTEMLTESEFQALEAETASQALDILTKAGPKITVIVTEASKS
jgi:hypothetical protein